MKKYHLNFDENSQLSGLVNQKTDKELLISEMTNEQLLADIQGVVDAANSQTEDYPADTLWIPCDEDEDGNIIWPEGWENAKRIEPSKNARTVGQYLLKNSNIGQIQQAANDDGNRAWRRKKKKR